MHNETISTAVDTASAATMVKVVPPATAGALLLFGIPLSNIALVITIIYTSLMLGLLIWDRFIKPKDKRCEVCGHYHNRDSDPKDCDDIKEDKSA